MGTDDALGRGQLLRRAALVLVAGGSALKGSTSAAAAPGCETREPIAQPAARTPRAFMRRAQALRAAAVARGDQPYGAVVAREGRIVGLGPSRVVTDGDPTAHAEMIAIRDAAARLGTGDLSGCVLYATSTPCAMCETAASFAGIARMIVGPGLADAGAPRYGGS